jgi:hypothetical protein
LKYKLAPAKFEVFTALLLLWLAGLTGLHDIKAANQPNIPEDQYPES